MIYQKRNPIAELLQIIRMRGDRMLEVYILDWLNTYVHEFHTQGFIEHSFDKNYAEHMERRTLETMIRDVVIEASVRTKQETDTGTAYRRSITILGDKPGKRL